VRRKDFSALPPAKIWFIEPMYARLIPSLPESQESQKEEPTSEGQ